MDREARSLWTLDSSPGRLGVKSPDLCLSSVAESDLPKCCAFEASAQHKVQIIVHLAAVVTLSDDLYIPKRPGDLY